MVPVLAQKSSRDEKYKNRDHKIAILLARLTIIGFLLVSGFADITSMYGI